MTLHLVKLSVGSTGPENLARWQSRQVAGGAARYPYHITRMFPRRADELLNGGSIYWVIQGYYAVRQRLVGIEPVLADDGTTKCRLDLDPELIPVAPHSKRPFQGWRYLPAEDAPPDAGTAGGDSQQLLRALSELGLL